MSTLLSGLMVGESPRWHAGRLWFSHWGTHEVVAVDADGQTETMAEVPATIAFSIDWLPDGRLLVVSGPEAKLLRQESDGSLVTHADLSGLAAGWNEIVVDGRGNIYVNGPGFNPMAGEAFRPGGVSHVAPDGTVRSSVPPSATRTHRLPGTSAYQTAFSASAQMPSGADSPRSAQTRRPDRLPSPAMSKPTS